MSAEPNFNPVAVWKCDRATCFFILFSALPIDVKACILLSLAAPPLAIFGQFSSGALDILHKHVALSSGHLQLHTARSLTF